jgi:Transport and Golgi organisation 2
MCTLTLFPTAKDGYLITMNRDESRTRPPALHLRTKLAMNGIRYSYPEDGQALGTWVAVNHLGLTLVLMNEHPPHYRPPARPMLTRGEIILKTIDNTTAREAIRKAAQLNPTSYPPFVLLAMGREGELQALFSNGSIFSQQRFPRQPRLMISSGFGSAEAKEVRESEFVRFQTRVSATDPTLAEALRMLHRSHEPEKSTLSICMHHERAGSVSLTQIETTKDKVEMNYYLGQPCETAEANRVTAAF